MLEVKRISRWEDTTAIQGLWNQWVEASAHSRIGVPSVFQTHEWNEAWWSVFGQSRELFVLTAYENGQCVGIAPLMMEWKWLPIPSKALKIIGGGNFASDYCAFIYPPGREDVIPAFLKWIDDHPEHWHEIDWVNLLEDSPEWRIAQDFYKNRQLKPFLPYLYDAPTRVLGRGNEDHEAVNKKSLKRHFNYFNKAGALEFKHWENADQIEERLEEFFQQHIDRRSLTKDPSPFHDPKQKDFYRAIIRLLLPKGWLKFATVTLDGKTLACHFGLEYQNKFYWYKPTFNIQYLKKSPGEVLIKFLLEYCISKQLKEFDFTVGSEGFKYRFANQIRKAYRLHVYRSVPQYYCFICVTALRKLKKKWLNKPQPNPVQSLPTATHPDAENSTDA